jgi:hypothetical protein
MVRWASVDGFILSVEDRLAWRSFSWTCGRTLGVPQVLVGGHHSRPVEGVDGDVGQEPFEVGAEADPFDNCLVDLSLLSVRYWVRPARGSASESMSRFYHQSGQIFLLAGSVRSFRSAASIVA